MGMAANQFFGDAPRHILKGKRALFFADLRLEHHLEQEIAQLLLVLGGLAGIHGVNHLVALFDEVLLKRFDGLFSVPRATLGGTELCHQIKEFLHEMHRGY